MSFQNASHIDASQGTFYSVGRDQVNNTTNHYTAGKLEEIARVVGHTTLIQVLSDLAREQALQNLSPIPMDASERPECLPATRVDLVKSILDWLVDTSKTENMLWLHGLAGSGKSTLATTIANALRESGHLGAFLFFDRDITEKSDPTSVIRTLAYQLGLFNPGIASEIAVVLEKIPTICMSPIRLQFFKLIVEPLLKWSTLRAGASLVLVIDALDECGNAKQRKLLLSVLAAESCKLPTGIRVLVTSRAEFDIRCAFEDEPNIISRELDITSKSNAEDILCYLRIRMSGIRRKKRYLHLPENWPGEENIWKLSQLASGLFIWASTASEFIDGHDPVKRLNVLLKADTASNAESALDVLYRTALESAGTWDDAEFVEDFRHILGVILVVMHPLAHWGVDALLGTAKCRPSMHTISLLACVLSQKPTVRVLHPSFADFLMDRERCGRDIWYIDANEHHRRVAIMCLERLGKTLKRNICDLTLEPRARRGNLDDISYSCPAWVEHVCTVTKDSKSIVEHVEIFLCQHLLHWLEAMSILCETRRTIVLLGNLLIWIKKHHPHHKALLELVDDALRFIQTFIGPIEENPLLVYNTAVPFSPVDSRLYKLFHNADSFPQVIGGFRKTWSPLLFVLLGHNGPIFSIAVAKDGHRLASASKDSTIRVWDMTLGVESLPPLQGHSLGVISIAFSSDGKRLASGAGDRTVRVWNVDDGTLVLPAFQGHEDIVTSVVFSSDGRLIVSGSADRTVRIWDVAGGTQLLEPLCGHRDRVSSVAITQDMSRIVSGSWDRTVRVWDRVSGRELISWIAHECPILSLDVSPDGRQIASGSADTCIGLWNIDSGSADAEPFQGHRNGVTSVSFSANGQRIVSGSEDLTIRIWEVSSRKQIFDPLNGHDRHISTVAYSHDGKRIISGSWDNTIRVWDSTMFCTLIEKEKREKKFCTKDLTYNQGHRECIFSLAFSPDNMCIASGSDILRIWDTVSGELICQSMQGNKHHILSVNFSPDGKRIVSGSEDTTICVWDPNSAVQVLGPIKGHEDCIITVCFMPDGKRIVSGSLDKTLRVWDSTSGSEMFDPLRGHKDSVTSVAISPDGNLIISGSLDRTVRIWDAKLGTEISTLSQEVDSSALVAFSSAGNQILAYSRLHHYVWNATTGALVRKTSQAQQACGNQIMMLVSNGWIKSGQRNVFLSKLPHMVNLRTISATSSSKERMAIGFESGQLLIIKFPDSMSKMLASAC